MGFIDWIARNLLKRKLKNDPEFQKANLEYEKSDEELREALSDYEKKYGNTEFVKKAKKFL